VFEVAQGAEGAGVEFDGFDGFGEFEFGHGVSLTGYSSGLGARISLKELLQVCDIPQAAASARRTH
jgi:hypothetical protein